MEPPHMVWLVSSFPTHAWLTRYRAYPVGVSEIDSTYSGKNSQGHNHSLHKIRRTGRADGMHYVIPRAKTPATKARDTRTTKPLTNWRPMQDLSDFRHMRLKSWGSRLGLRWIKQGWMLDKKWRGLSGRVIENIVLLVKWLLNRLLPPVNAILKIGREGRDGRDGKGRKGFKSSLS